MLCAHFSFGYKFKWMWCNFTIIAEFLYIWVGSRAHATAQMHIYLKLSSHSLSACNYKMHIYNCFVALFVWCWCASEVSLCRYYIDVKGDNRKLCCIKRIRQNASGYKECISLYKILISMCTWYNQLYRFFHLFDSSLWLQRFSFAISKNDIFSIFHSKMKKEFGNNDYYIILFKCSRTLATIWTIYAEIITQHTHKT